MDTDITLPGFNVVVDPRLAAPALELHIDAEPSGALSATARVNLYKLDREQGRGTELIGELQKMIEQADKPLPADVILYQLALTYEALGKSDDAKASWRRIVDEYPQSPYTADAQREAGPAPKGT